MKKKLSQRVEHFIQDKNILRSREWLRKRSEELIDGSEVLSCIPDHAIVLDIGTGKGDIAVTMKEKLKKDGKEITLLTLDPSDWPTTSNMKSLSQTKTGVKNNRGEMKPIQTGFVYATGENLPYQHDKVDITTLWYVLHHMRDIHAMEKALLEIVRVTKEGGDIFITEDYFDNTRQKVWVEIMDVLLNAFAEGGVKKHVHLKGSAFETLFQESGLTLIEKRVWGGKAGLQFITYHLKKLSSK
jgi:ubiquinone/menaquinone biosynthesis C-methylase UbiE